MIRRLLILFVVIYLAGVQSVAGQFYFILPDGTTNMVTNPSVELATTGYTLAVAGSMSRVSGVTRRGVWSLGVTPSSDTADGVYYGTLSLTNGQTYTASVDFLGQVGVPYRMYFASTAPAVLGTPTTFVGDGTWHRYAVTYTEVSTTTRRVYIVKNGSSDVGIFYIDGLQVENKAYDTTYCDGEVDGCVWNGTEHAATSTRSAAIRTGGKKIDPSIYNASLVSQQGTGMPPMRTISTPYGSRDGSYLQRQQVPERSFTLVYSVLGNGLAAYHQNRASLIDLIKPNNALSSSVYLPIVVGYGDGGKDIEIQCVYDDGLGMSDGKSDIESVPMKFIAHDPFWYHHGDTGVSLTAPSTFTGSQVAKRATDGTWTGIMPTATDNQINVGLAAPNGDIYIGGAFTTVNGVSATRIARYSGGTWASIAGNVITNGEVSGMTFWSDGKLYIVGSFTSVSGSAAKSYILQYDPVANTYASITPTAANSNIVNIVATQDYIYVSGNFTTINGVTSQYIARWNGTTWSILGSATAVSSALNQTPGLAADRAGRVYVSGPVTNINGIAEADYLAMWDGSWHAVVSGLTTAPASLAIDSNGMLYISINMTTVAGLTVNNTFRWNGSSVLTMRSGLGTTSNLVIMLPTPDGRVLFAGTAFSASLIGFTPPDDMLYWTGSTWVPLDVNMAGSPTFRSAWLGPDGSLYVSQDTTTPATATKAGITTATNTGSADSYPVITLRGAASGLATISSIINNTTGDAIYLNTNIAPTEKIVIDLRPNKKTITSSFWGNIANRVLPGSNLGTWRLAEGVNSISLMANSTSITGTMVWKNRCWSIDDGTP